MKITGITGSGNGNAVQPFTDEVTKNIERQIMLAQKELTELSQNEDLSAEKKLEKKQEIQQRIAELNSQLRQHQAELRKEQQQAAAESMDEMLDSSQGEYKTEDYHVSISEEGMQALASAESAKVVASAYEYVATKLEGDARVLESEIKTDAQRGVYSEAKSAALGDLEARISGVRVKQAGTLNEAAEKMQEAGEEETDRRKDSEDETIQESQTAGSEG